jgi:predicted adenine nucleotide alpha hydrolase (AANH) superfamily ATPase
MKINYDLVAQKEMERFKQEGKRPTLALHVCCAPCSSYSLLMLTNTFDVTVIYTNSNIYPQDEFNKRAKEAERFIELFNKEHNQNVNFILAPYEHDAFMEELKPYKDEIEGGARCVLCYKKRLIEAFEFAKVHNIEYVTTTLTISPHKNSEIINKIGETLEKQYYPIRYFYSDFKKRNGNLIAKRFKEKYNLYQQNYCGCEYSIRDEK